MLVYTPGTYRHTHINIIYIYYICIQRTHHLLAGARQPRHGREHGEGHQRQHDRGHDATHGGEGACDRPASHEGTEADAHRSTEADAHHVLIGVIFWIMVVKTQE